MMVDKRSVIPSFFIIHFLNVLCLSRGGLSCRLGLGWWESFSTILIVFFISFFFFFLLLLFLLITSLASCLLFGNGNSFAFFSWGCRFYGITALAVFTHF